MSPINCMISLQILLLVFVANYVCGAADDDTAEARIIMSDSYLDAYKQTHGLNEHVRVEKDADFHPIYKPDEYAPPKDGYGPPKDTYGPPKDTYGPPKDTYGPPKDTYGPPKDTYGPLPDVYGPPKDVPGPNPVYGVPNSVYGPPNIPVAPVYGPPPSTGYPVGEMLKAMPHAFLGLFDKLKFKLDLFTIGKIILKLMIFKKIVAMIAIICLLLFIPSLKHKSDNGSNNQSHDEVDMMDMMLRRRSFGADDKINRIEAFVKDAISNYATNSGAQMRSGDNCTTVYCKGAKLANYIDRKLSHEKLLDLYLAE